MKVYHWDLGQTLRKESRECCSSTATSVAAETCLDDSEGTGGASSSKDLGLGFAVPLGVV